MFTTITQLNEQQLKDLDGLRLRCKKENGSAPNLYAHILAQPRILPACTLYYENNQLLGFISIFFFYENAVEVSLLVDPTYRRRGLATALIRTVKPLLQTYHFEKLIFSSPHAMNNKWLSESGFTYTHCEYYMIRESLAPILEQNKDLKFRTAVMDDIPALFALDEACFHKQQDQAPERYNTLVDNRDYTIFVALKDNQLIGKAHLRWEAQGASLSDIAILPAQQGKGYGTELITHCINHAIGEGKLVISLDVETHNEKALQLYTHLGFLTHNACDYWTIPTEILLAKINELPIKSFLA